MMKRLANCVFIGVLTLSACFAGCEGGDSSPPDIEAVRTAADRSARFLVRNTREDGMFQYRINMNPAVVVPERYNLLRHAGTLYAMSMYYQVQPDPDMRSAIERAGRYLRDESLDLVPGNDYMLAVWSDPAVNRSGKPRQAKLGGAGLGLVALLSLEKMHPGFTPLPELQALGRFVVYMQNEDGSFNSKYIPSAGGRWNEWKSLFYPGEAALGLLMLYEIDESEVWIESASKALEYLAHGRKNETDVPADHWALLATAKLLSLENIDELPVPRQLLIDHAIQICNTMLRSQIEDPAKPEYDGGFASDGRTTPTATRLEGLQAALSFIPPDLEIHKRIESAIPRGMAYLLRAQVKEGEFVGAIPRATGRLGQDVQNADVFNYLSTEVRIDYVQHALSAMVQYLQRVGEYQ